MADPKSPDTRAETTDQLRHAIDSGQTGEKADWPDPAAAPLGTDDEAAGNPPDKATIASEPLARAQATPLGTSLGAAAVYMGIAALLIAGMIFIIVMVQG